MKKKSRRNGERGTQLVEMAVCLPILFFLGFLVIEGALFIRAHIVLNNAAREGAKAATLPESACNTTNVNYTSSGCQTFVQNAVVAYVQAEESGHSLINTSLLSGVSVAESTVPYSELVNGSPVTVLMDVSTVTVSYPYSFFWFFPGTTVQLKANATFRNFF